MKGESLESYVRDNATDKLRYDIYGRNYTFVKCHWVRGGWLVGYNTHRRRWAYLWDKYLQFENEMPVPARLISGQIS